MTVGSCAVGSVEKRFVVADFGGRGLCALEVDFSQRIETRVARRGKRLRPVKERCVSRVTPPFVMVGRTALAVQSDKMAMNSGIPCFCGDKPVTYCGEQSRLRLICLFSTVRIVRRRDLRREASGAERGGQLD